MLAARNLLLNEDGAPDLAEILGKMTRNFVLRMATRKPYVIQFDHT
jgi:hypothetical protein